MPSRISSVIANINESAERSTTYLISMEAFQLAVINFALICVTQVNISLSCFFSHDYLQRSRFVLYPDHELMSSQRVPPSGLRPRHDLVIIIFLNNVVVSTGQYIFSNHLKKNVGVSTGRYFVNNLSK